MSTEQYSIGYEEGYQAGWNAAMESLPAPVQQEPVAVVSGYYGGQCVILPINPARIFNSNTALYTSPPAQQEPLTDEEIAECAERMEASDPTDSFWCEFARAIEAKLKERNA